MKEKWNKVKVPQNKQRLIWIFPKFSPNNVHVPLIVIQIENDRHICLNYKSSQLKVEVEEI
jgi:hypothetical protein